MSLKSEMSNKKYIIHTAIFLIFTDLQWLSITSKVLPYPVEEKYFIVSIWRWDHLTPSLGWPQCWPCCSRPPKVVSWRYYQPPRCLSQVGHRVGHVRLHFYGFMNTPKMISSQQNVWSQQLSCKNWFRHQVDTKQTFKRYITISYHYNFFLGTVCLLVYIQKIIIRT